MPQHSAWRPTNLNWHYERALSVLIFTHLRTLNSGYRTPETHFPSVWSRQMSLLNGVK